MKTTNSIVRNALEAMNSAVVSNAKFKVGDKITDGNSVFLITAVNPRDYEWKLLRGDGKDVLGRSISAGGVISWADAKMRISNSCIYNDSIVRNAREAMNAAPRGITSSSKFRLKEDFKDDFGSYRKGQVFSIYSMGGISPKYGTLVVPGRDATLEVPWEKLEMVNARTIATNDNPKYASLERELKNALTSHNENTIRSAVRKVESQGLEWVAQMDNGLLVDNVDWIVKDMKYNERNPHYIKAVRITDKGAMWNAETVAKNTQGDMLSDAAYALRNAMKELTDSASSLRNYFGYKLRADAPASDVNTDKKLRAEVTKAQSQLSAISANVSALEKTVTALLKTADAAGF